MSILKVHRMGHPALRQSALEIPVDCIANTEMQRLVDDMIETMIDYQGVGLAAPQVGQSFRLIVLGFLEAEPGTEDIPLTVLFNPQWSAADDEQDINWEGCLSIPDIRGLVPRSRCGVAHGWDRQGIPLELKVSDHFARVLQHEIDHLDGVLYLDRMQDLGSLTFAEEFNRYYPSDKEDSAASNSS